MDEVCPECGAPLKYDPDRDLFCCTNRDCALRYNCGGDGWLEEEDRP